eukprot:TRINITY_DN2317_c0_g1_i2.p1 TRINITY_DN2317_c0_g1~~TRINITY_DN2317_c0_g1_i2.p1  ORF type:complete len:353 (-),score=107.15 TRINITY_DN2317_c0_g1_i2:321-1379(-)
MSEAMRKQKAKEGEALMKKADASLQTSWIKWSPNWAEACRCYKDAATCFKVGKVPDREIEALEKCAQANIQLELAYTAALCYQDAAEIALSLHENLHAKELFEQAAAHFGDQEMEKKALMTSAAAQASIGTDDAYAKEGMLAALDIFEAFDREYRAMETFDALIALMLSSQNYADAVNVMKRQNLAFGKLEQPHNIHRNLASIVIIHLAQDNTNVESAEQLFIEQCSEHDGYRRSDDGRFIDRLLDLVAHGPDEELASHVRRYQMMFKIPTVARMLKALKSLNQEIQQTSLDEFLARPESSQGAAGAGAGAAMSSTASSSVSSPVGAVPFGDGAVAVPIEDPTAEEDDDDLT